MMSQEVYTEPIQYQYSPMKFGDASMPALFDDGYEEQPSPPSEIEDTVQINGNASPGLPTFVECNTSDNYDCDDDGSAYFVEEFAEVVQVTPVAPSRKRKNSSDERNDGKKGKFTVHNDFLRLGGLAGPKKFQQMTMKSFMAEKASLIDEKKIKNLSDKYERQKRSQAMDELRNVAYALNALGKTDPDTLLFLRERGVVTPVESYFHRMYQRDIFEGLREELGLPPLP